MKEKFTSLAKEALSSGDKILSENYFQHADHFSRIVEAKSLNHNQNKVPVDTATKTSEVNSIESIGIGLAATLFDKNEKNNPLFTACIIDHILSNP